MGGFVLARISSRHRHHGNRWLKNDRSDGKNCEICGLAFSLARPDAALAAFNVRLRPPGPPRLAVPLQCREPPHHKAVKSIGKKIGK
jgi:hypothetical protein